jgi:hypothetical protein
VNPRSKKQVAAGDAVLAMMRQDLEKEVGEILTGLHVRMATCRNLLVRWVDYNELSTVEYGRKYPDADLENEGEKLIEKSKENNLATLGRGDLYANYAMALETFFSFVRGRVMHFSRNGKTVAEIRMDEDQVAFLERWIEAVDEARKKLP